MADSPKMQRFVESVRSPRGTWKSVLGLERAEPRHQRDPLWALDTAPRQLPLSQSRRRKHPLRTRERTHSAISVRFRSFLPVALLLGYLQFRYTRLDLKQPPKETGRKPKGLRTVRVAPNGEWAEEGTHPGPGFSEPAAHAQPLAPGRPGEQGSQALGQVSSRAPPPLSSLAAPGRRLPSLGSGSVTSLRALGRRPRALQVRKWATRGSWVVLDDGDDSDQGMGGVHTTGLSKSSSAGQKRGVLAVADVEHPADAHRRHRPLC